MSISGTIISTAIPLPLEGLFNYSVPPGMGLIKPGMRVLVPFGNRTLTAYTIAIEKTSPFELKDIIAILDKEPLVTPAEIDFFRWAASYYMHPLGEVLKAALPSGINITGKKHLVHLKDGTAVSEELLSGGRNVKKECFYRLARPAPGTRAPRGKKELVIKFMGDSEEASATLLRKNFGIGASGLRDLEADGWISVEERELYRDPFRDEIVMRDSPPSLTEAQNSAVEQIITAMESKTFAPFLLHGVTGSGKTEVYLHAISHTIAQGRNALILVPEIGLTPQLVKRFRARFGDGIAVLHSGLTPGERFDEWRRIRRNEASIVIGARSAIFAPLENIGVIVVDEEHDGSYKQAEGFRYNARDLALVRGKAEQSCVLLGSATPQVTTWHAAITGRIGTITLPVRVRELPMPEISLIDMSGKKNSTFSDELIRAMAANIAAGGQTLLFLNRRGFATYLVCQDCGHVFRCPNCSVSLTHHRKKGRHYCHYCDYSIPAPSVCPQCDGSDIVLLGRGTERVDDEVCELFPDARVVRMDRDTTAGKGGHSRILKKVEKGEVDILVGTQMVAKGHDFPGMTLVGVISVDSSLNLPDFRSAERTFQLLTQVSGRAGRGEQPGTVLIQTISHDHYAIVHAITHDSKAFCDEELVYREELDYPPFSYLALLEISGNSESIVDDAAKKTAAEISVQKRALRSRTNILGPAVAPLGMLRGRHRRHILLKAKNRNELHAIIKGTKESLKLPSTVRLTVDIDPLDML